MTLEENPAEFYQWLQHLQEEVLDAACYIERNNISGADIIAGRTKVSKRY